MAHNHIVADGDMHFTIDPATREITNGSGKATIIQNDHNSERFTFELPKIIDGHDMTACNAVQVHYLNIDAATRTQAAGIYEVDDLAVSPNSEDTVAFTWLLSRNATKYVGSLNFVIRFSCVAEDGAVEYAWHTAVFSGITIQSGIYNSEVIAEEYADILEQWKAEILAQAGNGGGSAIKAYTKWENSKEYKVGDLVIAVVADAKGVCTALLTCNKDHISIDEGPLAGSIQQENWDIEKIGVISAEKDFFGNIIHETYATKIELQDIQENSATKNELGGIYNTIYGTCATKEELTAAIGEALEGDY